MALNTLQTIAELTERLAPLANKKSGMPIEAADWNVVIAVLKGILEIDRAQDSGTSAVLADRFAPRVHEHLGQVSLSWLDPELQARVSDGGAAASTRTALAETAQKMSALGADVARLSATVDELQKRADRAATDELDRNRKLTEFDNRFSGLENLRVLVNQVSAQVSNVSKNVDQVLEFRRTLVDASGAPIDVAALAAETRSLGELRENLRGIDGKLVRLRDIELELERLDETTGGDKLDQRFGELAATLDSGLRAQVESDVSTLRADLEASLSLTSSALRAELASSIAGVETSLGSDLAADFASRETSLNARLDARLATESAAAREAAVRAAEERVNTRLANQPAEITAAVDRRVTESAAALRGEIAGRVSDEVRLALPGALAPMTTQLGAFDARLSAGIASIDASVERALDNRLPDLELRINARIDTGMTALRTSLESTVASRVTTEVDSRLASLDQRIGGAIDQRLGNLDARITSSVTGALQDLPALVNVAVQQQVAALDVSGQIDRASTKLVTQWRSELATASADTRALVSSSVKDVMTSVNTQITAAQRAAVEDSVRQATSLVAESEERLNKRIDTRTREVRDSLSSDLGGRITRLSEDVGKLSLPGRVPVTPRTPTRP